MALIRMAGENASQIPGLWAICIMLLVSKTQLTNSPLEWRCTADWTLIQLPDDFREMTHEVTMALCLAERTAHETTVLYRLLSVLQPV